MPGRSLGVFVTKRRIGMYDDERETTPDSDPLRRGRSNPPHASPLMTGDARTDRALLTLASLLAEIAVAVKCGTTHVVPTVDPPAGKALLSVGKHQHAPGK